MKSTKTTINCPECNAEINITELQHAQVSGEIRRELESTYKDQMDSVNAEKEQIAQIKIELNAEKQKADELVNQKVSHLLKEKESSLTATIKKRLAEEQSAAMAEMKSELEEKSEAIKDLNKKKAENEKLKREKDELEDKLRLEAEAEINQKLTVERAKMRESAEKKYELEIIELNKKLEDQQRLTQEMQRKQEQGSMQLQGEVQEIAIEEWLKKEFIFDEIEEIKKGARGADCLQTVMTRAQESCGSIYYESKRAAAFQESWIEKLKGDMREKNADIGVLVTAVLPKDMPRFGQRSGIWICTLEELKGLASVLRESLISINAAVLVQENKGEKTHMLYDYLTSNEFKLRIEAIVEGFRQMHTDLESEKRSMQAIWSKREKQIDKVVVNTVSMYGSMKGIAGNAVPSIPSLDLPEED